MTPGKSTDGPSARPFASPSAAHRDAVGRRGEELAARWLARQGWTVVGRRRRIGGVEIDILVRDRDGFVIVEVKTGSAGGHAAPEESVTEFKQSRLRQAALTLAAATDQPVRIDVIAVILPVRPGEPARLRHLRNAVEGE